MSIYGKNYNVEEFKKYNNFYTLLQEEKKRYRRVYNIEELNSIIDDSKDEILIIHKNAISDIKPDFIILGIKKVIIPIYGHFQTNDNIFAYTKLDPLKYKPLYNIKYLKAPLDSLVKPINSEYYKFTDIEDLKQSYLEIQKLELEKYKDEIKNNLRNIIQQDSFYIYEHKQIKKFINSEFLKIYLNGQEIEE